MVLLLGTHFKCFKLCFMFVFLQLHVFLDLHVLDADPRLQEPDVAAWVQLDTVVCLIIWAGNDIPVLVMTLQAKVIIAPAPGSH